MPSYTHWYWRGKFSPAKTLTRQVLPETVGFSNVTDLYVKKIEQNDHP